MKHDCWRTVLILPLLICSSTFLPAYSFQLEKFDKALQGLQLWVQERNPFDTSPPTEFVGTDFSYSRKVAFPEPKTFVAWAFPEERTECVSNPKSISNSPIRYVPPELRKCVAEIAQKTQVPILLPAKLPRKLSKNFFFISMFG
jgi:hypothetical protein